MLRHAAASSSIYLICKLVEFKLSIFVGFFTLFLFLCERLSSFYKCLQEGSFVFRTCSTEQ